MKISIIFSILAFIAVTLSICIKNRKKSLIVQSLNCLFEAIYDFLVNAITGAFLSIINFIRTMFFINKDKLNQKLYIFLLFFFEMIIIINCILTYQGYILLLPTIGSMIRVYTLWQTNMRLVRVSGITTGVFYGLYYSYYNGWFLVFGEILLLIISLISIYKYDIKEKKYETICN